MPLSSRDWHRRKASEDGGHMKVFRCLIGNESRLFQVVVTSSPTFAKSLDRCRRCCKLEVASGECRAMIALDFEISCSDARGVFNLVIAAPAMVFNQAMTFYRPCTDLLIGVISVELRTPF